MEIILWFLRLDDWLIRQLNPNSCNIHKYLPNVYVEKNCVHDNVLYLVTDIFRMLMDINYDLVTLHKIYSDYCFYADRILLFLNRRFRQYLKRSVHNVYCTSSNVHDEETNTEWDIFGTGEAICIWTKECG